MLENLSITTLKKIIRQYNIHTGIKGYSKLSKEDLIKHIHSKMTYENGQLYIKPLLNNKIDIPQPKIRVKKEKKVITQKPVKEKQIIEKEKTVDEILDNIFKEMFIFENKSSELQDINIPLINKRRKELSELYKELKPRDRTNKINDNIKKEFQTYYNQNEKLRQPIYKLKKEAEDIAEKNNLELSYLNKFILKYRNQDKKPVEQKQKQPVKKIEKKLKNEVQQAKEIINIPKIDENTNIINNWKDKYLGSIIYDTKLGNNLEIFISKKNKKKHFVDDAGLISFLKPIVNNIVEKYGVDELFRGIDKIAEYFDVEKYNKIFGTQKYLPVKDYFNVKNLKLVQTRNKQLFELN